jgi:hypothetical protein
MRFTTTVVAATALVVVAAPATAEPPRLAKYVDRFTTTHRHASSGRHAETDLIDPADPKNGKPPSFSHVRVAFAPGTVVDTRALPACTASDAELMAQGAAACPSTTRVGTGMADVDTGLPGPNRHVVADTVFLNAPGELVFVFTIRGNGARVVLHGKYSHRRLLDVDVPPLPGTPPDGGSETHEKIDLRAHARNGHAYIRTPCSCPRSKHWVNTVTYTFRDGVKQSFKTRTPCRRPKPSRPL